MSSLSATSAWLRVYIKEVVRVLASNTSWPIEIRCFIRARYDISVACSNRWLILYVLLYLFRRFSDKIIGSSSIRDCNLGLSYISGSIVLRLFDLFTNLRLRIIRIVFRAPSTFQRWDIEKRILSRASKTFLSISISLICGTFSHIDCISRVGFHLIEETLKSFLLIHN